MTPPPDNTPRTDKSDIEQRIAEYDRAELAQWEQRLGKPVVLHGDGSARAWSEPAGKTPRTCPELVVQGSEGLPRIPWLNPTSAELLLPEFEAVWQCIKRWDINVPDVYVGYMGATGNHVVAILHALKIVTSSEPTTPDAVRECAERCAEALHENDIGMFLKLPSKVLTPIIAETLAGVTRERDEARKLVNDFEQFALSVVPVELCLTYAANGRQYIGAAIRQLTATVERLTKERDEARLLVKRVKVHRDQALTLHAELTAAVDDFQHTAKYWCDEHAKVKKLFDDRLAENARLRGALEPFAALVKNSFQNSSDADFIYRFYNPGTGEGMRITVGHCRAAKAALEEK